MIDDLPGEEWMQSSNIDLDGIFVSIMGRVKMCLSHYEKLVKISMLKVNGREPVLMFSRKKRQYMVATEVLRAFMVTEEYIDQPRVVYKDGDRANCNLENLAWYGRDHLVEKCIKMAEESDHPLADCFLKFWMGDHHVLDDWFIKQRERIHAYISVCTSKQPLWWVDFHDVVQSALHDLFLSLYRGLLKNFDRLDNWVLSIAGGAFKKARGRRLDLGIDSVSDEDGKGLFLPDTEMYCYPSAEMQAIYREECQT